MLDFNTAFRKPFTDYRKLLIGLVISAVSSGIAYAGSLGGPTLVAILSLASMLIGLFVSGYYLKTGELSLKNKKLLPEWSNWKELFMKGIFITVIGVIYSLPLILLGLIFAGLLLVFKIKLLSIVLIALLLVLALFIVYFLPAGVLWFAKKQTLSAAFNFKDIFKKAFTKIYLVAWIVSLAYSLLLGLILVIIPVVGTSIASFISGLTGITLLAEAFRKS
ncbi:MAG: DUF4013 domain-containing protein [Nanoarchaeota archaeon]|nr:DUF4013 domain-containing protein [Nanoarchaeota archaeon]